MRKRVLNLLLIAVVALAIVPMVFIKAEAATPTINTTKVTLYVLDEWYEEYRSIDSSLPQEYQLVVKNAKNVSYSVTEGDSVTVSSKGLIKPNSITQYRIKGTMISYSYSTGREDEYTYDDYILGKSTVTVVADGQEFNVSVEVKDYVDKYVNDVFDNYISENIKNKGLSDIEKIEKICDFVCSYPYSTNPSYYVMVYTGEGGDCWASTYCIIEMAEKLGFEAWDRNGNKDSGAGSEHRNALVKTSDGTLYEVEAGYSTTSLPRPYHIKERYSLFSVRGVRDDDNNFIGYGVYQYDGNDANLKKLTIPEKINGEPVVSISSNFYKGSNVSNVETLSIPSTVTTIGENAFWGRKFKSYVVDKNNKNFKSVDGCLYTKDGKTLINVPTAYNKKLIAPKGVTHVGAGAMYYCTNIKNVVLPNGVKELGRGAFFTSSLENIYIPEGVKAIPEYTFSNSSVRTVYLPKSLTSIDANAFYGCFEGDGKYDIYYAGSKSDWKKITLSDATGDGADYSKLDPSKNSKLTIHYNCDYSPSFKLTLKKNSSFTLKNGVLNVDACSLTVSKVKEQFKNLPFLIVIKDSNGKTMRDKDKFTEDCIITISGPDGVSDTISKIKGLGHNYVKGVCTRCGAKKADEGSTKKDSKATDSAVSRSFKNGNSIRTYGDTRYQTSIQTANSLKTALGVDKFDTIIVAYGRNFADALAGSYLAAVKSAPILVVNTETDMSKTNADDYNSMQLVKDYIDKNLKSNGTVYVLGGKAVISESYENSLKKSGRTVKRLAGENRYETNIAILMEAGFKGQDLLVADAYGYADALSASSLGKPILLVDKNSGTLSAAQKAYLSGVTNSAKNVYLIGGTAAVPASIQSDITSVIPHAKYTRFAGANRYETSKLIADRFFKSPKAVVLAYGHNFPDGLCGGPLSFALGAPLLLTYPSADNSTYAKTYVKSNSSIKYVMILGGQGATTNPQLTDSLVDSIKHSKIVENKYK